MTTKICSKIGCDKTAKHKLTSATYCDKHYAWATKINNAKRRGKLIPSIEEFDALWEEATKNGFCCPVCNKKMVAKTMVGEPRGHVVSLQHWDNGKLELICHSCNVGHGGSKIGDGWKDIPKEHKYCSKCSRSKVVSDFGENNSRSGLLSSYCKNCSKQYGSQYRDQNKDKIKTYLEENKEKLRISQKAYREKNKNKIKAYKKAYQKENKDKIKAYRKKNKEKIKAQRRARYAQLKKKEENN